MGAMVVSAMAAPFFVPRRLRCGVSYLLMSFCRLYNLLSILFSIMSYSAALYPCNYPSNYSSADDDDAVLSAAASGIFCSVRLADYHQHDRSSWMLRLKLTSEHLFAFIPFISNVFMAQQCSFILYMTKK